MVLPVAKVYMLTLVHGTLNKAKSKLFFCHLNFCRAHGFTLLELLVVLVIVAILFSFATLSIRSNLILRRSKQSDMLLERLREDHEFEGTLEILEGSDEGVVGLEGSGLVELRLDVGALVLGEFSAFGFGLGGDVAGVLEEGPEFAEVGRSVAVVFVGIGVHGRSRAVGQDEGEEHVQARNAGFGWVEQLGVPLGSA